MIQSDNGSEFSSREFNQFLLKYNIEHTIFHLLKHIRNPYRNNLLSIVAYKMKTVFYLLKNRTPVF